MIKSIAVPLSHAKDISIPHIHASLVEHSSQVTQLIRDHAFTIIASDHSYIIIPSAAKTETAAMECTDIARFRLIALVQLLSLPLYTSIRK